MAAALIILTKELPVNESGLSGQPSVAGGPLDPSLASQPHSWSSCLKDFLIQQPDFESTDKGGEQWVIATAERVSNMYQLLGSVLAGIYDPHHYPASDEQPASPRG